MFDAKQFETYVSNLIREYNERDGIVEIEFSTSYAYLAKKRAILDKVLQEIRPFTWTNYWRVYHCDICKGYHADSPYHVILERITERWGDSGKES